MTLLRAVELEHHPDRHLPRCLCLCDDVVGTVGGVERKPPDAAPTGSASGIDGSYAAFLSPKEFVPEAAPERPPHPPHENPHWIDVWIADWEVQCCSEPPLAGQPWLGVAAVSGETVVAADGQQRLEPAPDGQVHFAGPVIKRFSDGHRIVDAGPMKIVVRRPSGDKAKSLAGTGRLWEDNHRMYGTDRDSDLLTSHGTVKGLWLVRSYYGWLDENGTRVMGVVGEGEPVSVNRVDRHEIERSSVRMAIAPVSTQPSRA